MPDWGLGAGIQGIFNLATSGINNAMAEKREAKAREENYKYGEMAADAADTRTRNLYEDLYSPAAKMNQIRDAGLSPALFGDIAGAGGAGQAGAQGSGASGVNPHTYGVDPISMADIHLKESQAKNLDADTENKETENKIKNLENQIKEIDFEKYQIENLALTMSVDYNGERMSLYEYAEHCTSYENFIHNLKKAQVPSNIVNSEYGQNTLREIYKARNQFSRDIAVLSEEETNAKFYESIARELKSKGFAELNAKEAISQLNANIETNNLTESQKEAWNNMIDKLGAKNSTLRDIVVVLGLILDRFSGKINVNAHRKTLKLAK